MPGPRPKKSLRLPKSRHLKQNREFARVRAEGKRIAKGCLAANWMELPDNKPSRLGVITSRKIGGAVVRSRARRLLREAFRLHQPDLLRPLDLVLIARASIVGRSFGEVERDYLAVMKQGGAIA